ncbi:MAG: hypothetical protein GY726_10510, partial [Proteobacteria bacterium]|nr:hypothetical protein [Pseudomonadota bacterium]
MLKKKAKLLARIEKQDNNGSTLSIQAQQPNKKSKKGNKTENLQKQMAKLNKQIAKQTNLEQQLAAKAQKQGPKIKALWLYTGEEGLYSITLANLAAKLGKTEKNLRNKANNGKLNLTTAEQLDSEKAQQPVSWHYDEASDSILFAAQAYDTFHSDENAHKFRASGNKAAPMAVATGAAPGFGSETPFWDTLKFEEEPDLNFATWSVGTETEADYWFWDYLYGTTRPELNIDLTIPDPATAGEAQLRVTLRGWTDWNDGNDHEVWAEINGDPVGSSIIWDAFEQVV